MALPVTISGASVGTRNSFHGTFKETDFYTILAGGTFGEALLAFKATDPTSSFTEQDSGNRPSLRGTVAAASVWSFLKGTTIHVSGQSSSTVKQVDYVAFDTSSDTWGTIVTVDSNPGGDDGPNAVACSIAVEGTGSDIIIAYQGEADKDMGTSYATIDYAKSTDGGSSWTDNANSVAGVANGVTHYTGPVIVRGSSDRMHIFFMDDTGNDGYQRTLRSDDTLETFPSAFDTTLGGAVYTFGPGISYDDGGTQKVRAPYHDGTSLRASIVELDSADTPTVTTTAGVSDSAIDVNASSNATVAMANNGTDEHLLYAEDTTQDIFHDVNTGAGWGTDTEVLDAVTVTHISPNIYDRSGTKLAYIYDDGGTVKYNEVDLGGAATTDIDGASVNSISGSVQSKVDRKIAGSSVNSVIANAFMAMDRKISASAFNDISASATLAVSRALLAAAVNDVISAARIGNDKSLDAAAINSIAANGDTLVTRNLVASAINDILSNAQSSVDRKLAGSSVNDILSSAETSVSRDLFASAVNNIVSDALLNNRRGLGASSVNDVISASFIGKAIQLAAAAINNIAASAETKRVRDLIANSVNVITATTLLANTRALSADAINVISAAASLANIRGLDASALNAIVGDADLKVSATIDLDAASVISISALSELANLRGFNATSVNIVVALANLAVTRGMNAASVNASSALAALANTRGLNASAVNVSIANAELEVISLNIVDLDGNAVVSVTGDAALAVMRDLSALSINAISANSYLAALRGLNADSLNTVQGQAFLALARDMAAEASVDIVGESFLGKTLALNAQAQNVVISAAELNIALPEPVIGVTQVLLDFQLYNHAVSDNRLYSPALDDGKLYTHSLSDSIP